MALVLGLVWKFLYFPVWSPSGSDMRILLAFIVVEPLEFVVARVGPAAWIIGGVGAYLIESARAKLTDIPSRSWNRERIAIGFAVGAGATFLAGPGVIVDLPFTLWFLIHAATGIMMDNSNGQPPVPPGVLMETEGSYDTDYATLLNKIDQAIAPNWILPNTGVLAGTFGPQLQDAAEVIQATQAGYQEKLLRASTEFGVSLRGVFDNTSFASFVNFVVNIVPSLKAGSSAAPFNVIDSLAPQDSHQNRNTEAEKPYWQLATLAAYDIVSDPTRTFLDFDGGGDPSSPWVQSSPPPVYNHFSGAAAVNLGQSTGPAKSTLFQQTHIDNGQIYDSYVYERDYTLGSTTAIVLYQPLSQSESPGHADGIVGGDTNSYLLPAGTYHYLNYDGSAGASVSGTALISNAQGIILISGPGSMTPAIQGGAGQAMPNLLPAPATETATAKLPLAAAGLSNIDASSVLFSENAETSAAMVNSVRPGLPDGRHLGSLQMDHRVWDDARLELWAPAGETERFHFWSNPRLKNSVQILALEEPGFDDLVDFLVLSAEWETRSAAT